MSVELNHRVFLGLGANIGNPQETLAQAVRAIHNLKFCEVSSISSLYRSKPVGLASQPDFFNAVIEIHTALAPIELLLALQNIENQFGRQREVRWGPRTLDIDILLYDDICCDSSELVIPHPRMFERAFVMVPFKEIASDFIYRAFGNDAADFFSAQDLEVAVRGSSWVRL